MQIGIVIWTLFGEIQMAFDVGWKEVVTLYLVWQDSG